MFNTKLFLLFIILTILIIYYTYSSNLRISIKKAKELIKLYNVKIIDVRTNYEWDIGHYKNAIHIPAKDINILNLSKNNIKSTDKIIVYCNTGQRAKIAAEKIYKLGFKNVKYIVEPYIFLN